jgi:hypothetical protein
VATVRTVEREIFNVEGFRVAIHHRGPGGQRGRDVRSDMRDLPGYPFKHQRSGADNVAAWRSGRFAQKYPGFTVAVLLHDGTEAHGGTLLATVRASYQ